MIYKRRTMPKQLQGLFALEKRLAKDHPELKNIESQIYNRRSGFGGEQHFDEKMTEFRPSYPHAILHGICLKQNGVFFEMDSILITPAFIIVFEAKNIGDKIIISSNPSQFLKESKDGNRKAMPSPFPELERKKFHLNEWLISRGIHIPIYNIVALAYSNELIVRNVTKAKVLFAYEIPEYLRTLSVDKPILTKKEIRKLAKEMINHHSEYDPFPMVSSLKIMPTDIIPGVICPACSLIGMQWQNQKWNCESCKYTGRTEHENAIRDWFMLIKNTITNQQFRYFNRIQSRYVAKRLLAKSNLEKNGDRKATYYVMKE